MENETSAATESVDTISEPIAQEQETEQVASTVDESAEEQSGPSMYELELDGEKVQLDQDTIKSLYQGKQSYETKYQEAIDAIEAISTDPIRALEALGVDFRDLAVNHLNQEIEYETLSDEERKIHDLEKRLQQYEESEKKAVEEQEQEEITALEQQYHHHYDQTISEAIGNSDLPKNAETVKRIASYMHNALTSNYDLSAEEAVKLVREDYRGEFKGVLSSIDNDEVLYDVLGDDIASRIRKRDLNRVKSSLRNGEREEIIPTQNNTKSPMTMSEFKESLRNY